MDKQMKKAALAAIVLVLAACGREEPSAAADAAGSAATATVQATPAAATPAPAAGDGPTVAEQYLMQQGVKITQAFVSRSNLKALVADNGAERRLFYVTPDGQSLISGMIFDAQGQNITSEDMARFNVRDVGGSQVLTTEQLDALWERADGLDYLAEGEGRPVYVIFDPNCPYCHRLWTMLRQVATTGDVQVRWLPVGILSESSKNLAAAMYQENTPQDALTAFGLGQLAPAATVDKASADRLAHNLLLLRDSGYTGVPTLLWKEDGQVRVRMEVPDDRDFASIFH